MSDQIPRRKYGFSMKIACSERDLCSSYESKILAEYFPDIPIIGCTSYSEFGLDCLPNVSNEPPDPKKGRHYIFGGCPDFASTVILIMTWGRLL